MGDIEVLFGCAYWPRPHVLWGTSFPHLLYLLQCLFFFHVPTLPLYRQIGKLQCITITHRANVIAFPLLTTPGIPVMRYSH